MADTDLIVLRNIAKTYRRGEETISIFADLNLTIRSGDFVAMMGPSGSGKELVAQAIHAASERQGGAFVAVNSGAIPADLIESELFGHEKGAFTGATETRKGWFERADGGTLFLDEVGELPLIVQKKFLRVLQEKKFRPIGSNHYENS